MFQSTAHALEPDLGSRVQSARARSRTTTWFRGAALLAAGLVFAACSSSTATTAPSQPAATTPPTPAASAAPSAVASFPTGAPTSLDPCQLVPANEASQLAGASYTAGVPSTTQGNGKICTYGSQTLDVFMVIVGQAPDVATAQAEVAAAQAAIKQQALGSPVKTTQLTGIGDNAVFLSLSETVAGQTINGSAIYVLKGTVFFGFSDLTRGHASATMAAMQAEAQAVLGRLP